MKVLIIGSKGFIGSSLLKFFRENGDNAYGCDVVVDYVDEQYFQLNIAIEQYDRPFKDHEYDVCVNCSGAASVPDSLKDPLRDFTLNTSNVFSILESIRKYNKKCKFINLSSAAVYGNPESLPIKESHKKNPVSPYGKHKSMSEEILEEFSAYYNVSTCSLRIFSAYGPGLKKQLFWDLNKKIQNSETQVDLFGTGNETRDFIFVDDVIQAILAVVKNASFSGESYNLANGEQLTIKSVVECFYRHIGWKGTLNFLGSNREGDPLNWEADIDKIKSLGYRQTVGIEQGLKQYAEWLQEEGLV